MTDSCDIETYPVDVFRSTALLMPYNDLLNFLRAFPLRVKDLNSYFWVCKGLQDAGKRTEDREAYVKALTYKGIVVEGSENYRFIDICGMEAGRNKDQHLMQYLINKGASLSFIYYGLISNEDKEDIKGAIELLEPHVEKKGYFYFYNRCLGEKDFPRLLREGLDKTAEWMSGFEHALIPVSNDVDWPDNVKLFDPDRVDAEIEACCIASAKRGVLDLCGGFDRNVCVVHLPELDVQAFTENTDAELDGKYINLAVRLLKDPDMKRSEARELIEFIVDMNSSEGMKYTTESDGGFFDLEDFGFVIGISDHHERLTWVEGEIAARFDMYAENNKSEQEGYEEEEKDMFVSLHDGFRWGQFGRGEGHLPSQVCGLEGIRQTILFRGYLEEIRMIYYSGWGDEDGNIGQYIEEDCIEHGLERLLKLLKTGERPIW